MATRRTLAEYDWANVAFDETPITDIKGFPRRTTSRDGHKVEFIAIHHMAMVGRGDGLAADACIRAWRERPASAHYCVDGRYVRQTVWDSDAAWAVGNLTANKRSISIEHANSTTGPSWRVSADTVATGARLVAHLCKAYGLGRPKLGVNVRLHKEFTQTACPGPYLGGSVVETYVAAAQRVYDGMGAGASVPSPSPTPAKRAIDLSNQKLTTDLKGKDGHALEVKQPQLATYTSDSYRWLPDGGLEMTAHANGATTPNSTKRRTEFRQMTDGGTKNAAWSNRTKTYTHSQTMAVTYLPKGSSVVIGQIHDANDDVVMIRATGLGGGYVRITAEKSLGKGKGSEKPPRVLAEKWALGVKFKVTIYATRTGVTVAFNNVAAKPWAGLVRSGCYFKVGAYLQDGPKATVVLYALNQTEAA